MRMVCFRHNIGDPVCIKKNMNKGTVLNIHYDASAKSNGKPDPDDVNELFKYYVQDEQGRFWWHNDDEIWFPDYEDKLDWKTEKRILETFIDAYLDNKNFSMVKYYADKLKKLEEDRKCEGGKT